MIYSKFPKKFIITTFIPESFPQNSTKFSENFLKNLVTIFLKFFQSTDLGDISLVKIL